MDISLKNEFKEKMLKRNYKAMGNIAGNILLRPNDNLKYMGNERLEAFKKAFEEVLEEKYLNDSLYKYYNNYKKKYGFCSFERWLSWYNN